MRKHTTDIVKALILSGLVCVWATGCGGDDSTGPDPEEPEFNIQTVSTQSHGEVLADGEGNVLYFYTPDVKGESNCTGGCLGNWPVYYVEQLDPGEGIDAASFGTITRSDGDMQTTYKGWPLYYFANDEQPGDVNGDGAAEGRWYVAKPDYSLMIASAQLVGLNGNNYVIDESDSSYATGEGSTTYFTDIEGRTLYTFANDAANTNNCTGGCIDAWPVFHVEIDALPSGMNADDFGTITAHGDRQQLTYKGWPVYYFAQDTERGDNKGVSAGPYVGSWPVITAYTPEAPPPSPNVQIASTASHGDILTDGEGNTLYFFTPDVQGESTCSGGCVGNWPIFDAGSVIPGEGLDSANFGSITRADDSNQTTYKGWPLYSFVGDAAPGDINGDGAGNGRWYVAKPDYSLMIASAQLVGADDNNYVIDSNSDYVVGEGNTTYFTDAEGRTLYAFSNDEANTNTFTNADFSNDSAWPIFYVEIEALPSGMNTGDFGDITVHGERQQLTYKGWPVYYFGGDSERGDNTGVSVPSPGVWPILNINTPDAP